MARGEEQGAGRDPRNQLEGCEEICFKKEAYADALKWPKDPVFEGVDTKFLPFGSLKKSPAYSIDDEAVNRQQNIEGKAEKKGEPEKSE